jgi:hypothetical protein
MESEINFKNAGEPWSQEEDDRLNKLYNVDMLDVIEISKIHCRAPGGIISRLCKNNYIPNRTLARGYLDYKNSDLYKEIVSSGLWKKENKKKEKVKSNLTLINNNSSLTNDDNQKPKIKLYQSKIKTDYLFLNEEVKEIKNELLELKTTIKELVEMMKAVYEFEDA